MIDWQNVEVGDVYERKDGEKIEVFACDRDKQSTLYPWILNGHTYAENGQRCVIYTTEIDIVAIHKRGTVGALSHEERSRLWDKMGEHLISVYYAKPNLVEAFTDGSHATGETPLEAVAKCVAAIEQQQKESK